MRIACELGRGATMSLLLPCSSKPLPVDASPAEEGTATPGRHRFLLGEDDNSMAELVGEMLGEFGYAHLRTRTAHTAFDTLARDDRSTVVFSDMVMPGTMGGLGDRGRWPSQDHPDDGYSEAAASALSEGRELLTNPTRCTRYARS